MQNVYYKVMMKCQCSCIIKHFAPRCVWFHETFLNKSNTNDTETLLVAAEMFQHPAGFTDFHSV